MERKKKLFSKKGFIFACGLAFVGAGFAIGGLFVSKNNQVAQEALALDAVQYMAWDEDSKSVKSVEGGCTEYTVVKDSTTSWTDGWYVVNSNVTISSRINVSGTVNLILAGNYQLTASKGIGIGESANINFYAQSLGDNAGRLIASPVDGYDATIGPTYGKECGNITIHGGNITATGSERGSAIGSSWNGGAGDITIYGGNINATGTSSGYAAVIGTGEAGTVNNIIINGGNITASVGENGLGAAIGTAQSNGSNVGSIVINGGTVTVNAYRYGAGIGSAEQGSCGSITINGGSITATGGFSAAGIGAGFDGTCGNIEINGGEISATGGNSSAGIGSGRDGRCQDITISNQVTSLVATKGIGSGYSIGRGVDGTCGTVIVCGGEGEVGEDTFTAPKITFNLNGGEIVDESIPRIYKTGAAVNLPTNLTKDNYTFAGWYSNSSCSGSAVTQIGTTETGNKEFWAKWQLISVIDLSTLTGDHTFVNSQTLTGQLNGNYRILVEDGATVTLNNVTINGNKNNRRPAIELLGDGGITISGTSTVKGQPGIYVPENKTLTIGGSGTLNAFGLYGGYGNIDGAAIGGSSGASCGNIIINSGTINANASDASEAAGIGGGTNQRCGDITINGGTITAIGGRYCAGIGSGEVEWNNNASCGNITINGGTVTARSECAPGIGAPQYGATCGNITITGGTVDARGGEESPGIGASKGSYNKASVCGDITITGGTVDARGGSESVGIGNYKEYARCGNITIANTVDLVAAYGTPYSIGGGSDCGTVTIGDKVFENGVTKSPYCFLNHDPVPYLTWDEDSKSIVQAEEDCDSFKIITSSTTTLDFDWYIVEGKVTFNVPLVVKGNANVILTDGSEIVANKGISADNASLSVYVQSEGNKAGKITATGGVGVTAIKGGAINIYGGVITATGGDWPDIGQDGGSGISGSVAIYGGKVTATGKRNGGGITFNGDYHDIVINGGKVIATGGSNGIGIGGDGGTITINGGNVTATGDGGPGIGQFNVTIRITGGEVTATGSSNFPGIGAGWDFEPNVTVIIEETVTKVMSYKGSICPYSVGATSLTEEGSVSVTIGGKDFGKGATKNVFVFPCYHLVTFETDGGEIDSSEFFEDFREDISTPLPTTVTKEHFTFEGWYENEDFTGEAVTEIPADTAEDKTYYAKWERITHDVTFNLNEGAWDGEHITKYGEGLTTNLPTNVVKDGYTFIGWYDNEGLTGYPVTAIGTDATTNKEYWASWLETSVYEADEAIDNLPPADEITLDDVADIQAAKAEYDALTPEEKTKVSPEALQKLLDAIEAMNTVVAQDATDDINALPEISKIKIEDKAEIDAAVAKYNALTDEQKEKVSKDTIDKLNAAVKEVNDIIAANDTTVLVDALPEVSEITLDNKEAVLAAKAAYDALTPEQKAKISQEVLSKLDDACARIAELENSEGTIEDIEALPAPENITIDDRADVEAAKAEYDALPTSEKEKVPQEVLDKLLEAVDKINTIVAEEATKDINALPEVSEITLEDKEEIEAIIAEYEALTPAQKEKLTPEVIRKFEAVKKEITDIIAANDTTVLVDALPDVSDVSLEDKDAITAAKAAYDTLTDDQKAKVDPEVVRKLESVTKEITDIVAAKETTDAVDAIPEIESITIDDRKTIEDAIAKYDALTDDQKAKVDPEVVTRLNNAKAKLDILIVEDTSGNIENLPEAKDVTLDDRKEIEETIAEYESLTPEQKEQLDPEIIEKIEAVEESLNTVVAEDATNDIEALPEISDITIDNKDEIDAAVEKYESLNDKQKDKLSPEVVEKIEEAKKEITDIVVAKETTEVIDSLPAAEEVSLDNREKIEEVIEAFDALTDDQKKKLTPETVEKYEEVKDAFDTVVAEDATNDVNGLPSVENISLDDKEKIENMIEKYESLTEDQKDKLPKEIVEKYEQAVQEYQAIDNANEAINELPNVTDITSEDIESVIEAKETYEGLTPAQQGKIPEETVQKLEEASHAVDVIVVDETKVVINDLEDITFDKDSKEKIEEARAAYNALTEEQKALFPKESLQMLENYEEAFDTKVKIDAIGEITFTSETKEAIVEARAAYNALTEEQKALLPNANLQKIEDGEAVYSVLDKIYAIGNAEYTAESETLIAEARKAYEGLSKQQKAMLNKADLAVLEDAENSYAGQESGATTIFIVLIIVVSLLLGLGLPLLVLMVLATFKNRKGLKAMSIAFIPAILATSHLLDGRFVALYVLAGVLLLVLIAIIVIVIKNPHIFKDIKNLFKKGEKMDMTPAPAVQTAPVAQPIPQPLLQEPVSDSEEEETVTVTDERGNIFQIRFIKSFTAKLIQANEESKKYYEELKNYVLSYKKVTSRVSWNYDSINSGRNPVLKFAVRGKTLGVYFPLNADDYAESKYKVEKVESKKFEDVPCLYRIKNDRRCEYAKELIDTVMNNLGLEKGEEQKESYYLHYEENKPLIARGLIKELKVQVNKPVARETQILSVVTNADGDEVVTKRDSKGNIFQIRYIKSFTAKLSQSEQEVKDYYNELKNYALGYKKANSRVSWHFDSINVGRNQVLKFVIRGKTLCLYYALNADDYAESKYKVEKVESKKFEDVPCLYRIKNDRRRDYAKDLIDTVMANVPTEKGKESHEDYRIPFEETKVLLGKGLIKEVKTKVNKPEETVHESISVHEADQRMSDEKAEEAIVEDYGSRKHEGKKGIINIDTISENFNDGDTVDIEALYSKKLIPSNVGFVKVLARGSLNKKLHLALQDYSLQAVKMIVLQGGTVKKTN